MTDVLLSWDTEDPIHPEADDALLRLCRLLSAAGVQGNFFVVGEKARLLRERGRRDCLEALAEHEVDYHGNYWFEFPEAAMVYGELPWDQAVNRGIEVELNGLHDVAEITGHWPVAWVQHQNNVSAMMPVIMRKCGVRVWNGGFASGDGLLGWLYDQAVVSRSGHVLSLQGDWTAGDSDPLNAVTPDRAVDPDAELRSFQESFDKLAARKSVVVPLGHPTCWEMSEWWGWYEWDELFHHRVPGPYPRGRQFRRVPRRSAADREAHYEWTRRAVEWLAGRADVRVTTFGEYYQRVAEPKLHWLTLEDMDALATASADGPTHLALAGTTLSAADALGALAHLFCHITRQGRLPERVPVQRLDGPAEAPWPAQAAKLVRASLFDLAPQLYDHCVERRRIPGVMRCRVDVGPAAAVMAFARAWLHYRREGAWPVELTVEPASALPQAGAMAFFAQPSNASTHAPEGFRSATIAERVRWQSWSFREFRS